MGSAILRSAAGKNLKPYQGLKRREGIRLARENQRAGKNLKPYQGLKLAETWGEAVGSFGRKKPKTLSGIETLGSWFFWF